jgi:hypothetical protein
VCECQLRQQRFCYRNMFRVCETLVRVQAQTAHQALPPMATIFLIYVHTMVLYNAVNVRKVEQSR